MEEAYLEIYSLEDVCLAPIETVVTLFTMKYCQSKINIKFVQSEKRDGERAYAIGLSNINYEIVSHEDIPYSVNSCILPIITINKRSCIAGLCAILRKIIKVTVSERPEDYCSELLGFKGSCLLACSESSIWTKFCEVDIITTVKFLHAADNVETSLPSSIVRFERHMSLPVKVHNLYKYKMSKKFSTTNGGISSDKSRLPEHVYAEGSYITLSDLIIFVCVHILLNVFSSSSLTKLLPLTIEWYERMMGNKLISKSLEGFLPLLNKSASNSTFDYILPFVPCDSLYKRDPKFEMRGKRYYTWQRNIENALKLIESLKIETTLDHGPFGAEIDIDRSSIPFEATPEGGHVPAARFNRKHEQLENMCKSVLKLAKPGEIIVDFCSGSGHLGILLAFLLPDCSIILLENKEESLNRAKERVRRLELANITFYQCNLDYFKGDFDIGVSLHACGVATDLVIQNCIRKKAVFVCCPCCYGSLRDCHNLSYPRSDFFKSRVERLDYEILSHAADQTHDLQNAKTQQGYQCMAIIDTDRKLQAEQFNYNVHLAKFIPDTCTPKNHLLVGIPRIRTELEEDPEDRSLHSLVQEFSQVFYKHV